MDVSKPFRDTLWIGTSKEYGWAVSMEYEGNHAYCQYCGLIGHTIGLCKKKRMVQGKAVAGEGINTNVTKKPQEKERWIPKATQAIIPVASTSNQVSIIPPARTRDTQSVEKIRTDSERENLVNAGPSKEADAVMEVNRNSQVMKLVEKNPIDDIQGADADMGMAINILLEQFKPTLNLEDLRRRECLASQDETQTHPRVNERSILSDV